LMVTSLIQHTLGVDTHFPHRFMFDMLIGPHLGEDLDELADPKCICQSSKAAIAEWRQHA
jgi:hypothetical protein